MSIERETICALATPVGTAAIALLRVSGGDCGRLVREIFAEGPQPRVARYRDYHDRDGRLLDDVVFIFFEGPRSYSGEDSLEISCHGNPFIAQKILGDLCARGCRMAEPGEFTQRAFLSGRMDLTQAEAVMDLIYARSERALTAANGLLRGALGRRVTRLADGLLDAVARIEAYIDFPEEDLPAEDRSAIAAQLQSILSDAETLLATNTYGELLREGIKTVILGAPNAGKSSLLNRMVGRERALVSHEPGTTRDFIEERIMIGPHGLRLIDTAGLNDSPAPLEGLGIEKTLECANAADIFLWVVDSTLPVPILPIELQALLKSKPTVLVLNKSDLVRDQLIPSNSVSHGFPSVELSALTGKGLENLRENLARLADSLQQDLGDDAVAINVRHAEALRRMLSALVEASSKLQKGISAELLASDLRAALDALGEIGGKIDHEQVLDRLFATFCIGK